MDTSKVETKAVAYVQDVLSNCPLLAASDIKIGDKEMSLDGSVRIHNTDNHTKHNLRGRVFVQVKGRTVGNISKETISYQAEVSDLRNYLQDGGAIYIVVYFGPNNARKIYYETLTVVKLKQYLSKVKSTQRKKSISLRALQTDTNDIETIFLNFYNDSMNQKGFANAHISSLEELQKIKGYKSVSISTIKRGPIPQNINDRLSAILDNELYLYAHIDGLDIPIPCSNTIKNIAFVKELKEPIKVGNAEFDLKCHVIKKDKNSLILRIGHTVDYIFAQDCGTVKCVLSKMHKDRLNTLKFFCAAINNLGFNIGGRDFNIDIYNTNFNINQFKNEINSLERLDTLLNTLHVSEQLDVVSLTEQDSHNINLLYKGLIEKQLLPNIENVNSPTIFNLKISNLTLKIVVYPISQDDGTILYKLEDFFHLSNILHSRAREEYCITPPYVALTIDEYATLSNIDYADIHMTLQSYLQSEENASMYANNALLCMLLAYDKTSKIQLLDAAEYIAEQLMNSDTPDLGMIAKRINIMQIIKRRRTFTKEETDLLYEIKADVNIDLIGKAAICLLLEEHNEARFYYDKLSSEEQKIFKAHPIYRFWNTELEAKTN